MVVPQDALARAREMLAGAKRPIFMHDDDCDGTASFVICYQFCQREGKSVPVKRSPVVGMTMLRNVEEYDADLVVILDKPRAERDFLTSVKRPVLWIDHHEPQRETVAGLSNVFYLNPRLWDDADNRPTSLWAYKITQTNLWLATIGAVADWHIPDYLPEFSSAYPKFAPPNAQRVEDVYLDTPIGTIIRVIQFNLKGQTAEAKKSVLTLTRIEDPAEILERTTARGRFLWKKYEKLAAGYDLLLEQARALPPDEILLFIYQDDSMTFTGELSNELLIRFPERVILTGRHHDGYYKCSLRSKSLELPTIISSCVTGLDGYGGGHRNACGLVVNERDWKTFEERFRKMVHERLQQK